jgi:hypothetical protein
MSNRSLIPDGAAHYDVFGRRIAIACSSDTLDAFVQDRWQPFLCDPTSTGDTADVIFCVNAGTSSRLHEWQFFNNGHLLVIADDRRLITGSFSRRPWQIYIEAFDRSDEDTYYYLLEPLLLMVLARLNLVHWHSAAVSLNGAGILLAGVSGSGKSTTTLNFLQAGYAFVADDEVFLEQREDGVTALGVDSSLYATDATLAMFPRLEHLKTMPQVRRGQGMKRCVPVRDLYPGPGPEREAPVVRVVLFPTVSTLERTELSPLSAGEAMRRFLSHKPKEYPTLVTDAPASQRRLDTYTALATTARCFDVALGRDASTLSSSIQEYLR